MLFRPGRVPGKTETKWRVWIAWIFNAILWAGIILTVKGCFH